MNLNCSPRSRDESNLLPALAPRVRRAGGSGACGRGARLTVRQRAGVVHLHGLTLGGKGLACVCVGVGAAGQTGRARQPTPGAAHAPSPALRLLTVTPWRGPAGQRAAPSPGGRWDRAVLERLFTPDCFAACIRPPGRYAELALGPYAKPYENARRSRRPGRPAGAPGAGGGRGAVPGRGGRRRARPGGGGGRGARRRQPGLSLKALTISLPSLLVVGSFVFWTCWPGQVARGEAGRGAPLRGDHDLIHPQVPPTGHLALPKPPNPRAAFRN